MRSVIGLLALSLAATAGTFPIRGDKGSGATNSATTFYGGIWSGVPHTASGAASVNNVVSQMQTAGTFSVLEIFVGANSLNTGTTTYTLQTGTGSYPPTLSNTAMSVSIATTDASTFVNETTHGGSAHTVHVNSGDWVAYKIITSGASGSIAFRSVAILFTPDNATLTLTRFGGYTSTSLGVSNTYYQPLSGFPQSNAARAAADATLKMRTGGTLQNACVVLSANTATNSTTIRTVVNGSNGGESVTIASGSGSGQYCLSGTDTVADGDLVTFQFNVGNGGGSGTFTVESYQIDFVTTDNTAMFAVQQAGISSFSGSTTGYMGPLGSFESNTNQGIYQLKVSDSWTVDRFGVYVPSQSLGSGSTVANLWKNNTSGSNSQQSIAFNASTPAWFDDTTHSDSYVANDTIELKLAVGTGTGFQLQAMTARVTVPASPTTVGYKHKGRIM